MTITPKLTAKAWVLFISLANLYGFFLILHYGNLNEVYDGYAHPDRISLTINIIFLFSFYATTFFLFYIFSNTKQIKPIEPEKISQKKRDIAENSIILLLILYIYLIFYTGIGTAGGEEKKESLGSIEYFFVLFRIDYFAIIYSFIFKNNKKTALIIFLVIISSLMRGWLGDLLLVFFLLVSSVGMKLRHIVFSRYSLIALLVIFSYEALMTARTAYRLGGIDLALIQDYSILSTSLFDATHELLLRFQQIYSLQYFYENIDYFRAAYNHNQITPIYFEGTIPKKIYDTLTGYTGESLGYILADHNKILIEGRKSAFSPGVIPYLYLDSFSLAYILLCPIICGLLASKLPKNNTARLAVFMYLINLFTFGWGNAFFSFLTTLTILVIFIATSLKTTNTNQKR